MTEKEIDKLIEQIEKMKEFDVSVVRLENKHYEAVRKKLKGSLTKNGIRIKKLV